MTMTNEINTPIPPPSDPNRLPNTFSSVPPDKHGSRWDALWREDFTPWDRGGSSAALAEVLTTHPQLFPHAAQERRRTALVPGCGRGYDVLLLASLGYDVTGLDFSPVALESAQRNEVLQQQQQRGNSSEAGREVERGTVRWTRGNFFEDEWLEKEILQFDLIFDYTFLCALAPPMRPKWAQRMTSLLAPEGRLVCLEWPPAALRDTGKGPPWVVTPETYLAHLSRPGEEIAYDGDKTWEVDTAKLNPPSATGLRRMVHITPSETHKAGKDDAGTILDRVSVWEHRPSKEKP